jgi:hypothetical protein
MLNGCLAKLEPAVQDESHRFVGFLADFATLFVDFAIRFVDFATLFVDVAAFLVDFATFLVDFAGFLVDLPGFLVAVGRRSGAPRNCETYRSTSMSACS